MGNRKRFALECARILILGPFILLFSILFGGNYPEPVTVSFFFRMLPHVYLALCVVSFPSRFILSTNTIRLYLVRGGCKENDSETFASLWYSASVGVAASLSSGLQGSTDPLTNHLQTMLSMFGVLLVVYTVIGVVLLGVIIFFPRVRDLLR